MYRSLVLCAFIALFAGMLYATIIEETASFSGFVYGEAPECEYDDWISHLTKKIAINDYNIYAPFFRNGVDYPFGNYHTPTSIQLQRWEVVCNTFLDEDFEGADELLIAYAFPYQVVRFNDTDTDRQYYMLRETLNPNHADDQGTSETTDDVYGGFDYSWGLFVVWPEAPQPIIVTFVHPGDDYMVPPLVVKAFQEWDAKYVMLAGASREASWSNVGTYTNNKSLSDPSRYEGHPYNYFYRSACREIRQTFERHEYSVQLHSYDWNSNTHAGAANVQISAGNGQDYPSLPIRDFSTRKLDVVNTTDYLVYPANTIGLHDPVYITDYYTVYYNRNLAPFFFDDGEHVVPVTNYITLPGAETNVQFLYTNSGANKYDVANRFLHVEFDELPYCYPHTERVWKWFYGYDITTDTFNMRHRFDNSFKYYSPFIEKLGAVIHEMLLLDDLQPVATPENFAILSVESTKINLSWTAVDCYDFYTYEVLYSTTPESNTPSVRDRIDASRLASAQTGLYTLDGLTIGNTYYVSIRAMDYNGNVSEASPEISATLGLADITYDDTTEVLSLDSLVTLKWAGANQSVNMLGYNVYRTTVGGATEMVGSWQIVPSLRRTAANQSYTFTDYTPVNYTNYEYYISTVDDENEYPHYHRLIASPRPMYVINFSDINDTNIDATTVGFSPFANDGPDNSPAYDVASQTTATHSIRSYQPDWYIGSVQGVRLSRELKSEFDIQNGYKSFIIRLRSNLRNMKVFIDDSNLTGNEKVVFEDATNGIAVNLRATDYSFFLPTNDYYNFNLHIGNVRPVPEVNNSASISNKLFTTGDALIIDYTTSFPQLLDHYLIKLENETASLVIAENIATSDSLLTFTIPENITMHNATLVFETHCVDGEIVAYQTATGIGVLPNEVTVSYNPVNNFVANPFLANPLSLAALGIEGDLFRLVNQEWSAAEQIGFGVGYFFKPTALFEETYTHNILKSATSLQVVNGWNLIANPHLLDFHIQDLSFFYNGGTYQYIELLQNNLLLPYVRVLRDGIITDTTVVHAQEAFLLYANVATNAIVSVIFTPYNENHALISNSFLWQGNVSVRYQSDETTSDAIIVSATEGTPPPIENIIYHNPKSVALPNGFSLYLKETDDSENRYHSRTIEKMEEDDALYTAIPFTLELPSLEPIIFDTAILIEGLQYSMRVAIDSLEYTPPFNYVPNDLVISGEIRIANEFLTPVADQTITPFKISAYPNPFNPTTNIAFNLVKDAHVSVDVYNIKGQRVKRIVNEPFKSGNHTVTWNGVDATGKSVGSGIYFIAVNAGGQNRVVKKVTLLK